MRNEAEIPVLVAEIRDEIARLEKVTISLEQRKGPLETEEITDSAALRLHNFYTGCERIFKLIVAEINGISLHDLEWHKRLLNQMTLEIPKLRPAVISTETRKSLEELLRFRHLVRNVYGYELKPERVEQLVALCLATFPQLKKEMESFLTFLNGLHYAAQSSSQN